MHLNLEHITFKAQKEINKILAPLTRMSDICYFSYGENNLDSSCFTLLTHPEYYNNCLIEEFPLCGFHLKSGWHHWDGSLPHQQTEISSSLNIGNGIIYVNHYADKSVIVEFASHKQNNSVKDFYLNNQLLLKRFVNYFINEAKPLIAQAKKETIKPNRAMVATPKTNPIDINNVDEIAKILQKLPLTRGKLSARELECFLMLIKGFSLNEISQATTLAIPTIANYISRIKLKLNCSSRKEMIQKAADSGLVEFN
ncbi:MAG: helix-turn-helix transcriptional regulator [Proteobacteria bacterium]|nr:helix-turn-helix transcriptional regulator [Pseudomonadota bacterium]